ncbi:hypothetical protein MJG53_004762, partial [Ovis ammon polii x Ovis aries]
RNCFQAPTQSSSVSQLRFYQIICEQANIPRRHGGMRGGEVSRRQFGPKAREEVKIIEHQTQTLRLMPHLATALALTFAGRYASTLLDEDIFRGKELVSSRTLQALVAGLKAYSTWENVSCLQDCRECTGGMGYMMENQISGLKCDTDVFVTFEGDNVVMLQVVVRELLAQYTKQCEERPVSSVLRNWAESGSDRLRTSFLAFNMDTVGNLTFLLKAVHFRERTLQRGLVARIYYKVMTEKEDFFSAWNSCLHHITCLSLAHIHRVSLEQFCLAVRNCPDQEDQALLKKHLENNGIVYSLVEKHRNRKNNTMKVYFLHGSGGGSCLCVPEGGTPVTPEVEWRERERERTGGEMGPKFWAAAAFVLSLGRFGGPAPSAGALRTMPDARSTDNQRQEGLPRPPGHAVDEPLAVGPARSRGARSS